MTTTKESAEALALRGLLLVVVEIQNIVRQIGVTHQEMDPFVGLEQIDQLVESAPTRELVQLAQAALESSPPLEPCNPAEGRHPGAFAAFDKNGSVICSRCRANVRVSWAIPAAAAGVHE